VKQNDCITVVELRPVSNCEHCLHCFTARSAVNVPETHRWLARWV